MAADAEDRSPQHSVSILTKYYSSVESLRTYLSSILQTSPEFWLSHAGQMEALLDTSYIGVKYIRGTTFRVYSTMLDMREVIDQAQERLFKSKKPQNIITSGYRLVKMFRFCHNFLYPTQSFQARHDGDHGRRGMARIGITNFFINTVINALYSPEWETLLTCVGEDAMIHLLTETSIFVSLPNGCLCQITGEPLIHLSPKSRIVEPSQRIQIQQPTAKENFGKKRAWTEMEDAHQQPQPKRRKLESISTGIAVGWKKLTQAKLSSPADVCVARVKIFYAKPNYLPHSNRLLVGLPLRHILNRLEPSYMRDATSPTYDSRQISENTRRLSKYIFPRQYGLHTPFSCAPTRGFSFIDYIDREAEIKAAGHRKTPKRLKNVLPILGKLIHYHAKCGYLPLRDISCPSKILSTGKSNIDSSVILEIMSETSVQLHSQPPIFGANTSLDSNGNRIMPLGSTQAHKHASNKPRFAEFACSYVEVYRYVVLITNAIIPKALWGSNRNLKIVLQYVMEFISCRRYETLSLHHVLQNFSTSDCDWLIPPGTGASRQARVSVSDALKRRELLEDFLFWFLDSFVLPLLRTTFYVTDSSAFRNQVLYFRQDDWRTLCTPLIERLTSVTFEELTDTEAADILRQRRLGFSFVRLLPKETGIRPIVNLRRKKGSGKGIITTEQSINQILQAAFSILTYEKINQPHLLGASIFSPDEIYDKLKKLKKNLLEPANACLPKLYFVKLDVQACFDTIDQTKLLQILRQIISEDTYMLQKYGQINTSLGRIRRKYVRKAVPEDDHPHFLRYAADLAAVLRNTIFVDQVIYPISKKQEILQLLEEHITENIVKIGRSYYRQMVGIPQGSVLSSILCSFFYGDLEKTFSRFTDDGDSVLLRMVDDYLYITTNLQQAKDFLSLMKKGHPEYGCSISTDKTLTNFDTGDGSMNVVDPSQKTFPWCGYTINMQDLSVTADYTRYHGTSVRSTLTIERGRQAGMAFAHKLMQLVKTRGHIIFSDRHLNSWHVVHLNIYQNFLMTAVKMHEYLQDWGAGRWINYDFLRSVIEKTIAYNYSFLRLQGRRMKNEDRSSTLGIRKEGVFCLGHHAFHHVLVRKPTRYGMILKWLGLEIKRRKYRRYLRKFRTLIKEGQAGLTHVVTD